MGILTPAFANWAWKSRPLRPGSRTSSTRQLGPSNGPPVRNSSVLPNAAERSPTDLRSAWIAWQTEGSSSTMKTIDGSCPVTFETRSPPRALSPTAMPLIFLTACLTDHNPFTQMVLALRIRKSGIQLVNRPEFHQTKVKKSSNDLSCSLELHSCAISVRDGTESVAPIAIAYPAPASPAPSRVGL